MDFEQQKSLVDQKEAEYKEMQDQIESYNQMVKQLANQREMAVRRLAEMDTQIQELTKLLETERLQVDNKDKELKSKRTQLQTLKNEEDELTEKFNVSQRELSATTENLASARLTETQIKNKITDLKQFLATTNVAIDDIEKAISIKDTIKLSALCDQPLTPPPLSVNVLLTNGIRPKSATSSTVDGFGTSFGNQPDSQVNFNDSMFDSAAQFDPFANDDPFDGDDPFKTEVSNSALPEDDPFAPKKN